MSEIIIKTSSETDIWNVARRYRVGKTTTHSDQIWSNITGSNSEPGIGTDWILISAIQKRVTIVNGHLFTLSKHPNNVISTLEINDAITDGWWDNTSFIESAVYIGGDINTRSNWNEMTSHDDIPLN